MPNIRPPDLPDIDPADDGTPFSDDPVEHSILSATFMVGIMVTWLILGHKIQGMFSWCALTAWHMPLAVARTERDRSGYLQDQVDI